MKKYNYIAPQTKIIMLGADEVLQQLPGASQFDNDGDGITDQRPPIIGDPDEVGGKPINLWEYSEEQE